MARRFLSAIIAPLVVFALAGCSNVPGKDGDERPANPLLYEIASADGTVQGWMLGTIHALPDGTAWRTPAISKVAGEADMLVVEVRDLKGADPAIYRGLAQTPDQPPIADRVPAQLKGPLAALMARGDLSGDAFATTKTWAAALALARVDAAGDPANGVDQALIEDFSGRPVREFEGLRGQLAIFDRLPESAQRSMLAAVVREGETGAKDPERLQRAWLAGDAATIEASTREGFLADPVLHEALLTARNRRWANSLVPLLEQRPRPLVAVGTAHLVGPEGLAALLEARGYRVRRIP